ncbi:MAG: Maf family nucleotide pyrophosphatase [Bacteroidales bacterium]|nr:Maf family nucleotide pyrophosphatase [Bacteroidales bacterium]
MTGYPFTPYQHRYLLASNSKRRRELLSLLGLRFEVVSADAGAETYPETLACSEVPQYLARMKSLAYHRPIPDGCLLITADTVVCIDGAVLGKPASREEALDMLGRLSGRTHEVFTGVCLRDARRSDTFCDATKVSFRPLSTGEAAFYVDTFQPYDKAGAYGIQEWIGYTAVSRIEGSYYNVMGLPVEMLYERLKKFFEDEK